jgi:excisionase family DNA binding protein
MQSSSKPFYSTSEAAKLLGVSVTTVQGLVEAGTLAAWKTKGGHRRIPRDAILAVKQKSGSFSKSLAEEFDSIADLSKIDHTEKLASKINARLDIMIVEDDPLFVSLYEGALSEYSDLYILRVCADGLEALIELGKRQPDFLLLDIDLPNVNGFEMLRSINKQRSKKMTEVLVITGLESKQLAQHSDLLQAFNVVSKPIDPQFFKGYLTSLFATRKASTRLRA